MSTPAGIFTSYGYLDDNADPLARTHTEPDENTYLVTDHVGGPTAGYDYGHHFLGRTLAASLFSAADYIAAHKDVTQRVVNAYVKTLKWIATHTPARATSRRGRVVRLELEPEMPDSLVQELIEGLDAQTAIVSETRGFLGMNDLAQLVEEDRQRTANLERQWQAYVVENREPWDKSRLRALKTKGRG